MCDPFFIFLGSDTTSSFYGKGKVKAWRTLCENPQFANTFSMLGNSFPPSQILVNQLNKFVCLLYGDKKSATSNECRYALFKAGKYSDDVLPPNCDCLYKHIERVNYQTAVWNGSLSAQMNLPTPAGNGWVLSNDDLEIEWMTRPPAADSLLACVNCSCKTGCQTMRCSCMKATLRCSDFCSCSDNCVNSDTR